MAQELKSQGNYFAGFGTGPKSPAKYEIHGNDYTVSLFKDNSVLGVHKNGAVETREPCYCSYDAASDVAATLRSIS
jgi:hypothetical protein